MRHKLHVEYRCYGCGSSTTLSQPNGADRWYLNHDEDNNMLCHLCNNKFVNHPINFPKRINFKGKRVTIGFNPRKGICSLCGKKAKTHMHHIEYHEENPAKDTIEVCVKCHGQEHAKLRKMEVI